MRQYQVFYMYYVLSMKVNIYLEWENKSQQINFIKLTNTFVYHKIQENDILY